MGPPAGAPSAAAKRRRAFRKDALRDEPYQILRTESTAAMVATSDEQPRAPDLRTAAASCGSMGSSAILTPMSWVNLQTNDLE
jgi:hypothetical protein